MSFIFEQIKTGGDRNFGYLIGDRESGEAVLIDPSYQPELLVERAKEQGLEVQLVINTHGHGDHTNGNNTVQEMTGAKIAVFQGSAVPHDVELQDNQELKVGRFTLKILYVPGHSPDHIVVYNPEYKIAITGDHLFVGKIGGTMGSDDARQQFHSLQKMINELPAETTVWPGHDVGCRPSSTMAIEVATNPFLLAADFESFSEIKANWSQIKQAQGLI